MTDNSPLEFTHADLRLIDAALVTADEEHRKYAEKLRADGKFDEAKRYENLAYRMRCLMCKVEEIKTAMPREFRYVYGD